MSGRVLVQREAKIDLLQHYTYIGERNIAAAKRFLAAAREDVRKLADMPNMGARREFAHPLLLNVRSWSVGGFRNDLIFYQSKPDGISVLAVLRGAMDIEAALEART